MPSRFFMERHLLEIDKLLEGREFESPEEAQAFLDLEMGEGYRPQGATDDRERALDWLDERWDRFL